MTGGRQNLFAAWESVSRRLTKADHWLLLFDLDGTLAAITSTPEKTVLDSSARDDLRRLAARPDCDVGIVSGRSVAQVRRLIRLPDLTYVGNHGLEIQNSGWSFVHPKANSLAPVMERMEKQLKKELQDIPGVSVENKSLGLCVHYRRVKAPLVLPLIGRVRRWWRTLPDAAYFELQRGKKILEIRPALHWNKGSAVVWLKHFVPPNSLILYAGDDQTDEDAFRAIRSKGISIHVGSRRPSHARYFLQRQTDVSLLLKRLLALPQGGSYA